MATIDGTNFNEYGLEKPTLVGTNGHDSILNSSLFEFGDNDNLSL